MSKTTVDLPTDRLEVGMYVVHLDRPWIETPFLFQGFVISSTDEIAELQRLCKVVGVDVTTSEAEVAVRRAAAAPVRASRSRSDEAEGRTPPPVLLDDSSRIAMSRMCGRVDPVPLRTEIKAAQAVHTDAKKIVAQMIDQLRSGKKLSVPDMAVVVESMVDSVLRNREAMMWLNRIRGKDDYVYSHSLGASIWALTLGRHMNLDKEMLKAVALGAMLLDVGKTRIATQLLQKPGKLTDEERTEVRRHVEYGLDIVRETPGTDDIVISMIATHHERFDGSGYPHGLAGDSLPLVGRIASIVDSYDAMTSFRLYAKPVSTYDAVRELKRLTGSWFHAEIVEQLIQAVGVFPTGTLVELNTGEVGVVIGQSQYRRLRPEVMLILDEQKQLRREFASVDLQSEESDSMTPTVWITRGLEPGAYGIDPAEYFL